ncbi:hypothetical protein MCOR16_010397 [Pyricularia oryzae]|nr:hypothetical protein MCOR16_010397 [Pyricularia oryzae]KAI6552722.1 hypothetical protein MCOR09_010785 [Pyricularia oryzae]
MTSQQVPFLDLIQPFQAINSLLLLGGYPLRPDVLHSHVSRLFEARVSQPGVLVCWLPIAKTALGDDQGGDVRPQTLDVDRCIRLLLRGQLPEVETVAPEAAVVGRAALPRAIVLDLGVGEKVSQGGSGLDDVELLGADQREIYFVVDDASSTVPVEKTQASGVGSCAE